MRIGGPFLMEMLSVCFRPKEKICLQPSAELEKRCRLRPCINRRFAAAAFPLPGWAAEFFKGLRPPFSASG
jgi:hypothetical protein